MLEVVGLTIRRGQLRWRVDSAALPGLTPPEELARVLTGVDVVRDADVVLHSTSWRHTGAELVLTYAVFPDLHADGDGQRLTPHLVTGPGPLHPAPLLVGAEHVAAHAVRHLADLAAGRDPHVVGCAERRPAEWKLLAEYAARVHVHPALPVPLAITG